VAVALVCCGSSVSTPLSGVDSKSKASSGMERCSGQDREGELIRQCSDKGTLMTVKAISRFGKQSRD